MPYPIRENAEQNPHLYLAMGTTAENVAKKYKISRKEQQEFALQSHDKAYYAQNQGKFKSEIVSINNIEVDGNIRPKSTMDKLNKLKPAFDSNGTVTAATASALTDGAAVTLICEENFAKQNKLEIYGRIKSTAIELSLIHI